MTSFGSKLIYIVSFWVICLSTLALTHTAAPVPSAEQAAQTTFTARPGVSFVNPATPVSVSATTSFTAGQTAHAVHPEVLASYGRLPLAFEANEGQVNSDVKFLAHSRGYVLLLTATDATLRLRSGAKPAGLEPSFLRMKLAGTNAKLSVSGADELPGKTNYFIGKDPAKWHTNVPTYSKVHYSSVYPGVDLLYYGHEGSLEYDFVVSPGADPGAISLAFEGAVPVIDDHGDLVLKVGQDEVRLRKPVVYQETGEHSGGRRYVDGQYRLTADGQATFLLGSYEKRRALVIDPILTYSTFLGGSSSDGAYGIFVDAAGNAYVTGGTTSADFPVPLGFQTTYGGTNPNCTEEPLFQCGDVFVTKVNPTATAIVWSTYIGGNSSEVGFGISADASGVYVAGQTSSANFPTTVGAFQTALSGARGGFVTKLNPTGSALVYSTYLAGSTNDKVHGLAVDSGGNAYVTGATQSDDFPTTPGAFQLGLAGTSNAFVSKLNPTGSALVYSTYLGGNTSDGANSIAIDKSGNAYVTGGTTSTTFPTKNPIQAAFAGGNIACPATHVSICGDAFVSELNPTGTALVFSTYLGGTGEDSGVGIALDPAGNVYVSGGTDSADFPTTAGVVQPAFGGGSAGCTTAGEACGDAFLTKINAAKTAIVYSTYLGGSGDDVAGFGLAIDAAGNVHMAGITGPAASGLDNFPTTANAIQPAFAGGTGIPNCAPGFVCGDAFVTKFSLDASSLAYSTYLGGSLDDGAASVVQDTAGNDYVVGVTISSNFPVTPGVFQPTCGTAPLCNDGAGSDAFITKLAIPFPIASPAPLNVNFGNQVVNVKSQPMPVTLTNSGTDNLLIASIVDANGFSQTNNCPIAPAPLAPLQFCTINITFTPSGLGTQNDTLIITDDAAGSPQTVPLTGVGQAPGPIAKLAPVSLNFNTPQLLGTTSTAQPVTLSNTGTGPLTITSIGFTGANASEFGQTNNCGSSLAVNASCTISVTFSPTVAGNAAAAASLTVTDNAPGSPQAASLAGTVQSFSLTTTCTSLSVVPGQSAIYTVDLAPVNGFTQSVALSCSGAPTLAKCTVNPSSMTLDGATTVQAKVTATTTPPTSGFLKSPFNGHDGNRMAGVIGLAGMAGLAAFVMLPGKSRVKHAGRLCGLIFCLCLLASVATMSSCGVGGGNADPPGTAAGTYPLTVTGTFKSAAGTTFTEKVSFNLVVK
jgi:hypothetical protein